MIHIQKIIILTIFILGFSGTSAVLAHPWGGLVVDEHGNIYFTFIYPFIGDDHYACVWRVNDNNEINSVLVSKHSYSDIILARNQNRTIFGAERINTGAGFQARLWQFKQPSWEPVIAPTTDGNLFHIQAYAVNNEGTVFFARDAQLFKRDRTGAVSLVEVNGTFGRIDAMAWGPDDRLYIIEQGAVRILATNGTLITLATGLKEEEPEDLPFAGANILFDLAVDEGGNVFVAYYGNRRILKVSASGEITTYVRSTTPWSPHGVDVYNGAVYILESTLESDSWWKFWERPVIRPRVRKVTPDGKITTIFEYNRGN